ncbi:MULTISPECIES: hypothetical protein [unclassified Sporosarcina]|uniref:hypothetical protein n=1 Tax=unclassified Sporosarcina TaxID=2647733 RepID=UPI001A926245|nr:MULTISPECIES: hypothetical protein [unclassified Sporosarcina]MBO0588181.1 hypothetical protein [Sporosarcina sp. E16_8]MBO0601935.1 hypothetical protein [Sporosarcina sp. E16_3]
MDKTTFIFLLPDNIQRAIENELKEKLSEEDFQLAISSRLCDLEDTINIYKYINN